METEKKEKNSSWIIVIIIIILIVIAFTLNKRKEAVIIPEQEVDLIQDSEVLDDEGIEVKYKEVLEDEGIENSDPEVQDAIKESFNTLLIEGGEAFVEADYEKAKEAYKEARTFIDSDIVYRRLFTIYGIEGNIEEALKAINKAIEINDDFTIYWTSKLQFLEEKTDISFAELENIYKAGLLKVSSEAKVNLVTIFAGISEKAGEINKAKELWIYAIELYPAGTELYQAEIDRLTTDN